MNKYLRLEKARPHRKIIGGPIDKPYDYHFHSRRLFHYFEKLDDLLFVDFFDRVHLDVFHGFSTPLEESLLLFCQPLQGKPQIDMVLERCNIKFTTWLLCRVSIAGHPHLEFLVNLRERRKDNLA